MPNGNNCLSWQQAVAFLKNAMQSFLAALLINQRVDQPFTQLYETYQTSQ
jgi:hypothetical protein